MTPGKIRIIMPSYVGGGAEKVTDSIVLSLQATGRYDIGLMVYITTEEYVLNARKRGIKIERLPGSENAVDTTGFTTDEMTSYIGRKLKEEGVNVAIMSMLPLDNLKLLRREALGCKILYHLHGMPMYEVQDRLFLKNVNAGWAKALLRRLRERLFHTYAHHIETYYRHIYNHVDGFIVLCQSYRSKVDKIVGATEFDSHVVSIYNPLTTTCADDGVDHHGKTVLYVGRLCFGDKRVDRLLRIWKRVVGKHSDWTLKIVGDGPDRDELIALTSDLGIGDSVQFCGYTTDPTPYYKEASILCLTSQFEGFGMSVMEAQAAGVWPVCFNVSDGVRELIARKGRRGTLVRPYSERAYARKLSKLMDNPQMLAEARPALKESTRKYDIKKITMDWERFLHFIY